MENKEVHQSQASARGVWAGLLLVGGLICGIYFLAFFDTSVQVPQQEIMGQVIGGERVNNLGLVQEQQYGIYLGFGAAAVGLILNFTGDRRKEKEQG